MLEDPLYVLVDTAFILTGKLFTIKFIHDGYGLAHLKQLSSDIRIVPDIKTKKVFENFCIDYSFYNDTLICFQRCSDPDVPFITFTEETRIRFMVNVSASFLERTDVEATGKDEVYHFQNKDNAASNLFISQNTTAVNDDDLAEMGEEIEGTPCFAIIDIFTEGTTPSYSLLSTSNPQKLKSPVYKIRFGSLI